MPVLSVIVPIYGTENYIERCAESLFAQKLENIEFIFVDDCSPDRSMFLLDRIVNKHREHISNMRWIVKTVHMLSNCGLSEVRRRGIECATGSYIIHCDSDDWIDPEMYRSMYEKAIIEDADVVVCDFNVTDGHRVLRQVKGCGTTDKSGFLRRLLSQVDSWSLCNKMFKKSMYYHSDIVFPKGKMGEDFVITIQLILNSERICYLPMSLYNYFVNPASITHASLEGGRMENFWENKNNADIIFTVINQEKLSQEYAPAIVARKWGIKKTLWDTIFDRKKRKLWIDIYREINSKVLINSIISIKDKVKFILTYLSLYP